ncbi:hypothetical protein C7459_10454 [Tumebacillus permanentifrigoris]|uniref:Uncharacterized protein n=1 Tax=Tumebacillus permanentifrigoris TaxID=378543 RepID=A0A316DB76_9BACL|nr:hypothetical protein C7459_10454 [Tumebacillus permanentifrigoris]
MTRRQQHGFVTWQDWMYYAPVVRYQHPTYASHGYPYQPLHRVWSIGGDWQTNYGPMNLRLLEDRITVLGTYQAGTSHGEIMGAMHGTTMVGHWRRLYPAGDRDNAGRIEFRFNANGDVFDGNWSYGNTAPDPSKKWTGTKILR